MANFTSTSGSYTTTLTVTQTSQNTASNTSTLTYSLTLTKNAGSGLWNNNSCPWSITIDGTQVASGTFTYDFRNYSSLTLKSSTTTTVNHNSDGTKTVSVSASVNMNNSDYVSVMQPSGSLTLTTIPRASDVTVSNYSITNTTGSISATITSKANFYHKWRYKVGSGSWSAWQNKGQINNTSSTVTVANTTLLAGMPTSTSATFYIEVQTYSDSGYATLVGTKSASSTITVNTSNIKPSISLGNIAINSSPISGYAVAGYSSVKSTATTTNSSGASSVTNYFTVSHGSLVSSSSTTTSTTVTSNTVPASSSNYTLTIYAYAKDSRGAVSSTVSKTITVYGYQPPTATLNAYRVASSSATTEDGAGTYAYVTFSGAVSSSVNSQNTVQSTTCTYSGSISGTATSGGHYALADTQTVTFTLTVTDKVTSSTVQKTVNTATYPLDLYDNGSGTVGVGLGMVATGGWHESNLKNAFYKMSILREHYASAPTSTLSTTTTYVVLCTFTITGTYANSAIQLTVSKRANAYPTHLSILFNSVNSTDVTVNNMWADSYVNTFWIYKSSTTTFQLITSLSGYDWPSITDVQAGKYQLDRISIDYAMSVISAVPDGAIQATQWAYAKADTASSATYATNATNATNATYSTTSYGIELQSLPANADLNSTTYQKGYWYSASSSTTSSLVNKPTDATSVVLLEGLPMTRNLPTGTWYYGIQRISDYDGEMWIRSVIGNGTAGSLTFTAWRKVETSAVIWSSNILGGNQATITNGKSYSRFKVYALVGAAVYTVWDIDVKNIGTTGYKYSHAVPMYISDPGDWYLTIIETNCSQNSNNVVLGVNFYNKRIGTSGQSTQNNNSNYKIYRIEGIL